MVWIITDYLKINLQIINSLLYKNNDHINLANNCLINLMGLSSLKTLKELDIDFNSIQDLTPLVALENL